jgi:hypothetical protein
MYKLGEKFRNTNEPICIWRLADNASIPLVNNNSDYQKFKNDIQGLSKGFDGNLIVASELQDADGNVMSAEEAKAYIATLPA